MLSLEDRKFQRDMCAVGRRLSSVKGRPGRHYKVAVVGVSVGFFTMPIPLWVKDRASKRRAKRNRGKLGVRPRMRAGR